MIKHALHFVQRALALAAVAALLCLLVLNACRVLRPWRAPCQGQVCPSRPRGAFSLRTGLRSPQLLSLTIRNRSSRPVSDVWLWNAAEPNFFSAATIVESTVGPAMTEEEAAVRLWQVVFENSFHYWPATLGLELHDPATLFAAYGYGICDDRAAVLATLACAAGLPARTVGFQARVPGRDREVGHVLAEIFCGGRWRMFDPDHGLVFRQAGRVLSLREARAGLMRKAVAPEGGTWPAELAEALIRDAKVGRLDYPMQPPRPQPYASREMGLTLRRGERVAFDFNARSVCHAMVPLPPWHRGGTLPPRFANGTIRHKLRLDDAHSVVAAEGVTRSSPAVSLAGSTGVGSVLYGLRFPFPLLDAECEFKLAGPSARVETYVTTHERFKLFSDEPVLCRSNRWWRKLRPVSGPGRHRISLTPFFRASTEMPTRYGYLLKLELSSSQGPCRVSDVEVATTFQFAPANVFRLHSGENIIRFFGDFEMTAAPERLLPDGTAELRAESERLEVVIRCREGE